MKVWLICSQSLYLSHKCPRTGTFGHGQGTPTNLSKKDQMTRMYSAQIGFRHFQANQCTSPSTLDSSLPSPIQIGLEFAGAVIRPDDRLPRSHHAPRGLRSGIQFGPPVSPRSGEVCQGTVVTLLYRSSVHKSEDPDAPKCFLKWIQLNASNTTLFNYV